MKKLYLIDGNSLIYRMFFAVPPFTTSAGKHVNAIFGVAKFFLGQIQQESPDYLVFVRDAKGDNFRHQVYSDYKAQRERMPDNLRDQVDDINRMVNTMGFEVIEIPGYEADDVIATLAKKYENQYEVFILSGDKDLHALVNDNVKIYDTLKRKIYGPRETLEKFEVPADKVRDYLAIVGDSSDNFPGISGIGPKKAVVLLNTIGSLEKIYEIIDRVQNGEKIEEILGLPLTHEVCKILSGKTLEKFIEGRELAFISQKLATLDEHVPLQDFSLDTYLFHLEKLKTPEVSDFFHEMEFKSLTVNTESTSVLKKWEDTGLKVKIIGENSTLQELQKIISTYETIVIDTETTNIDPIIAELVGVSIYLDETHIYYINLQHRGPHVDAGELRRFVQWLFQQQITLVGHNIKYDLEVFDRFLSKQVNHFQKNTQDPLF